MTILKTNWVNEHHYDYYHQHHIAADIYEISSKTLLESRWCQWDILRFSGSQLPRFPDSQILRFSDSLNFSLLQFAEIYEPSNPIGIFNETKRTIGVLPTFIQTFGQLSPFFLSSAHIRPEFRWKGDFLSNKTKQNKTKLTATPRLLDSIINNKRKIK